MHSSPQSKNDDQVAVQPVLPDEFQRGDGKFLARNFHRPSTLLVQRAGGKNNSQRSGGEQRG